MKRTEIIDEDGNVIAPPEPGSALSQIIYLMEYGRTRGFQIGPHVQFGDVIVTVKDLRQERAFAKDAKRDTDAPELDPESDMALVLGAGSRT
jgi:hypothetical protein